ncbi:MAG: zf-HC2 domain-containing protein [Armatimonadetes bacterium]|nr:zf-HC2 domain-containing protein [Armatimonadota bacterium]
MTNDRCDLQRIHDYAEGYLDPTEVARAAEHLRSCESCREAMREWQAVSDFIAGMPVLNAPPARPYWTARSEVWAPMRAAALWLLVALPVALSIQFAPDRQMIAGIAADPQRSVAAPFEWVSNGANHAWRLISQW